MRRRGLRSWIRRHRRLEILVRLRHPLVRRLPPGRLILEQLGLAPHLAGYRRAALRFQHAGEIPVEPPREMEEGFALESAEALAGAAPHIDEEPKVAEPRGVASPVTQEPASTALASSDTAQGEAKLERSHRPQPASLSLPSDSGGPTTPGQTAATHPGYPPGLPGRPLEQDLSPTTVPSAPIAPGVISRAGPAPSPQHAEQSVAPAQPPAPSQRVTRPARAAEPELVAEQPSARPQAAVEPDSQSMSAPREQVERQELLDRAAAPEPSSEDQSLAEPAEVAEPRIEAGSHIEAGREDPDRRGVTTIGDAEEVITTTAAPASDSTTAPSTPPRAAPRVAEQRQARRPPSSGSPPRGSPRPRTPEGPAEPRSRPADRPAATAAPEEGELFARATDRSVGEWRRLLIEATSEPAAPARTSPSTTRPTARPAAASHEPVLETTRQFIRPLIGIDPNSVRVHRGTEARQATEAAGADALAVGDDVAFPATHDERTPEGLGLLAHELTHVARRRHPRFVPPIARAAKAGAAATGYVAEHRGGTRSRSTSPPGAVPGPEPASGEEELARQVEGIVRSEARAATQSPSGIDYQAEPAPAALRRRPPLSPERLAPSPPDRVEEQENVAPWGDLPAPWEPLPVFEGGANGSVDVQPGSIGAPVPATVHRAPTDRTVEESPPASAPQAPATAGAPSPDLDALARQVYDVLKRRLAAERRREG